MTAASLPLSQSGSRTSWPHSFVDIRVTFFDQASSFHRLPLLRHSLRVRSFSSPFNRCCVFPLSTPREADSQSHVSLLIVAGCLTFIAFHCKSARMSFKMPLEDMFGWARRLQVPSRLSSIYRKPNLDFGCRFHISGGGNLDAFIQSS